MEVKNHVTIIYISIYLIYISNFPSISDFLCMHIYMCQYAHKPTYIISALICVSIFLVYNIGSSINPEIVKKCQSFHINNGISSCRISLMVKSNTPTQEGGRKGEGREEAMHF